MPLLVRPIVLRARWRSGVRREDGEEETLTLRSTVHRYASLPGSRKSERAAPSPKLRPLMLMILSPFANSPQRWAIDPLMIPHTTPPCNVRPQPSGSAALLCPLMRPTRVVNVADGEALTLNMPLSLKVGSDIDI